MTKYNFIRNDLKSKIINHEYLTKEEIEFFFKYIVYKTKVITTYKKKINSNISKEYASIVSEILFSYNREKELREINNHYFCITKLNNEKYLCDPLEDKYYCLHLSQKNYQEYVTYIKENYHE